MASKIDQQLERAGVGFARYADDTLIWSTSYDRISTAASVLHDASESIGVSINFAKSKGVRLLTRQETIHTEMSATSGVDYLGHEVTLDGIRIKANSLSKIKNRINNLIYSNLIRDLKLKTFNPQRITGNDKDYIVFILQLRRYLYGPLSETAIRKLQNGSIPPMSFEGVMAFFPLVNDDHQLSELDGWLLRQVWLAIRQRTRMLDTLGIKAPAPADLAPHQLLDFSRTSKTTGDKLDLALPSFSRIAKIIRKAIRTHGLEAIQKNPPIYLYED